MAATPVSARRAFIARLAAGSAGVAIGGSIADASVQRATEPAAPTSPAVMDALCRYLVKAPDTALPAAVVEKAKHHIMDTVTAIVSGAEFKVGRLAQSFAQQEGGSPEAQVSGSGLLTTATQAALANGTMAHADETDDSHEASGTHPGCAIVPAALAVAERQGASGAAFLRAVVAGYDIGCRINLALDTALLVETNHSTHAIGGGFGAAVAAASLLGLTAEQWRFVMDYTAQQASGVRYWARDREHVEKAFVFGGMPARSGVTAAMLVASGFTGVDDCFSGEHNFFAAFSTAPKPARLVDGLGTRFEVMATNIKKFPVGSPIQAPLEALTRLIEQHRLRAGEVKAIDVRMPSKRTVDNREMPDINLQYILAVAMVDGGLSFEAAHSYERMKDPAVLRMKARITVTEDPTLRLPHTVRTGITAVTRHDGSVVREHVTAVPGTSERPMTRAEVERKCLGILSPVLGADRAGQLAAAIWAIESLADARALRPLMRLAASRG